MPFEIPDSWEWVRLKSLVSGFQYGTSRKSEIVGSVPVLRMGNILCDGEIGFCDLVYTSNNEDIEQYALKAGDLLFNRTNSPEWVGKTAVVRCNQPCIFAGYLVRIKPIFVSSDYLNAAMNTCHHRMMCNAAKTDAVNQSNINAQKLSQFLYPVPPLQEQMRVVTALALFLQMIQKIEHDEARLISLATQAKAKILDLAIRGKLVPQDPNDEPASVLLERIREEKERLIVEGKIKRDKKESYIFRGDDNSYYENLPAGWVVYRLKDLFSIIGGGTPLTSNPAYWGEGIPWFSSADIDNKGNILPRRYVTSLGVERSTTDAVPAGSIVVATRVGLGKVAILNKKMCFSQDNQALIPKFSGVVNNHYLYHFMYNEMQTLQHSGRGTTISGITKKQLADIELWLPPHAEQKLIVSAIEAAYELLERIVDNLN